MPGKHLTPMGNALIPRGLDSPSVDDQRHGPVVWVCGHSLLVIKRPAWHGNHTDQGKTCHHLQGFDAERPPNAPRGYPTQHRCCAS